MIWVQDGAYGIVVPFLFLRKMLQIILAKLLILFRVWNIIYTELFDEVQSDEIYISKKLKMGLSPRRVGFFVMRDNRRSI